MSTELMTRSDRETLVKIARQRERLAKTEAKERAAILVADFEKQLDRRYHFNENHVWEAATKTAKQVVNDANEQIAAECARLGIPGQFAPKLTMGWSDRGRNDAKEERAEMRRVAMKTIEALERSAKTAIERRSLETQEKIMVGGLTTDDARLFLAAMPTAEALMPAISVDSVETLLLEEKS
jgi:vacuolar-type H+-ATPase subunit H